MPFWDAWCALQEARQRYNEAATPVEIDARIYELKAAEIRFGAAVKKAKGAMIHAESNADS